MKSIFSSKVFWANVLTVLVVIAGQFGIVPETDGAFLLTISPIINIILRYFTKVPVTII